MFISDQKCSNRLQTVAAIETATVVTMKLAIRPLFMSLTTPKFRLRSVVRQNTTTALYYPPFLERLSDQCTDLFFVAAATKKRLHGNAKDLSNDKPQGRATATFRTLI